MSDSGKAAGGHARAEKLSSRRRTAIAKKAAQARWDDSIAQAVCGSPDHPLKIGNVEIPCYVLDDGRRVLLQGGMLQGMDMKQGTAGRGEGDRLVRFVETKALSPFVGQELREMIRNPIHFRVPSGSLAYGYEATILADLCDAVLEARKNKVLNYQQVHIAERCEILVRGFARVGIIALVDEATGYQEFRARDALAKILEAFVAKELQPYVPTFGRDFYQEMFRLRGLDYPNASVKRPQYFGHLTNDIIYKRLAPGVLEELKRVTQVTEDGRRKHKLFQRLTQNTGYPKLKEHLGAVVAIMQLSDSWKDFMGKLNRLRPYATGQLLLPFPEDDQDTGQGL
ncbi:MAG: P63C domain-containing protein [Pirellulaceae bacterium]|nr:P63C domain-containing protein [Pirellulaceae bacterium]